MTSDNENKEKIKKYYDENKDKIKKYYDENKDKIKDKARQKVNCPKCNKELSKGSLTRHFKSKHTKEI